MKLTFRTPEGVKTMTEDEVSQWAANYASTCPSEITCAFRVWYEGFEGYGMPTKQIVSAIEKGIEDSGCWTGCGLKRFEKYGVVNAFTNTDYTNAAKEKDGNPMILHKFHTGAKYRGPDGKVFWIPVAEVFDLRAFEYQDGKYVGNMVEIDPNSDYAKAMVEI